MKRIALKIIGNILLIPVRLIEWTYSKLWDEEAAKSPDAYLHQKLIWEARRIRREIEKAINP